MTNIILMMFFTKTFQINLTKVSVSRYYFVVQLKIHLFHGKGDVFTSI